MLRWREWTKQRTLAMLMILVETTLVGWSLGTWMGECNEYPIK